MVHDAIRLHFRIDFSFGPGKIALRLSGYLPSFWVHFSFRVQNLGGQKLNYFSVIKTDLEQFSDGLHIFRKIHQSLIPPILAKNGGRQLS